ncbi:hypothetical protein J6590_048010 [Homalodisca vitripennis]|nr:hypothetical protein J6590_048010 [Homalodisca vitripennis]
MTDRCPGVPRVTGDGLFACPEGRLEPLTTFSPAGSDPKSTISPIKAELFQTFSPDKPRPCRPHLIRLPAIGTPKRSNINQVVRQIKVRTSEFSITVFPELCTRLSLK